MNRFLFLIADATVSSFVLIPIFVWFKKYYIKDFKKTVVYLIFAVYLSAIYSVAGLPDICYVRFSPHFNWHPFAYMFSDMTNTLLNILLFIPLGIFLPCLWKPYSRFFPTVVFGFCLSLLVETLQIFTYRASDINDLMTNTFGTVMGWIGAHVLMSLFPDIFPEENCKALTAVCCITFMVMFFLQPPLSNWLWAFIL